MSIFCPARSQHSANQARRPPFPRYRYWRRNDFSVWRYIDIVWVQIGLWYQIYRAYNSSLCRLYYAVIAVACCSFLLAVWFAREKNPSCAMLSFLCHSLVHVLGNVANVVLYTSDV